MNENIIELHITIVEAGSAITILKGYCLQKKIILSKGQLKQAIAKGALWLTQGQHTQRLRRLKRVLQPNDELHFYYNEAILSTKVDKAVLISDEMHYSVWYKPYGMLSQGSKWSDHCTITRFAQQMLEPERPVFIVHRLDRAASGLILVAHTKTAARGLSAIFEHRTLSNTSNPTINKKPTAAILNKYYHVILEGNHSLRPQPDIIKNAIEGKEAQSTFTHLTYNKAQDRSLVTVKIDTGRKHQIRIHAAMIEMPVVGDRLHGHADENEIKNLQLSAVSLSFTCPITEDKKHFELEDALKLSF